MKLRWLVLVAACGTSARPTAPVAPTAATQPAASSAKSADPHAAVAARARADAALEQQLPPDYERPFAAKPVDRSAIAKLYGEACRFGDKRSCIFEAQLAPLDAKGASYRAVVTNCLDGDRLSCRALPPDDGEPRFPNAPGALSRRIECQKFKFDAGCDLAGLHRECSEDFAEACAQIGNAVPGQPDADDAMDRRAKVSVDGCRGGIASECMYVPPWKHSDYLEASRRLCDLRPDECANLASLYKSSNDRTKERDAWERACEYGGNPGECIELAVGYIEGRLEEPVPGRGQAVLAWSCRKLDELKNFVALERHPQCKTLASH